MVFLVCSSASKASSTTLGIGQCSNFLQAWVENSFANKLSYAITFGDSELNIGMIEQDNADISTIIFIDYSRADVDEVFGGQTWAWSDTAVTAFRKLDLNVSFNN